VYQDFEVNLGPIPVSTTPPAGTSATGQSMSCTIQKAGGPGPDATTRAQWIWILDTGINGTHPDLNVRTSHAMSFIAGQAWEDGHGHGTHCAGIAAAKNNGLGVVGVSPGAWVVPVKVLDNTGHGSFSGILAGLNYVSSHDIAGDVVSMSIGTDPISNCLAAIVPINQAIYNLTVAGTWVVMAAGNNGVCGGAAQSLPGCIYATPIGGQWQQMTKAVTVGSIECNGTRAGYSNWGPHPPMDWVAVGSNVYSTYKNHGYATMSGTSMATPAVAGIIHARNGNPPVISGSATACGLAVPIAHR
jgi:subtilisin family serine protease